MVKKNNAYVMQQLIEATGRSEADCALINEVLNSHFLIGHNNKEKIKADFMEKLSISEEEADHLYNTCIDVIMTK